ncbi:MAG: hypothetical protein AB7N80_08685 [Bdellovibrionales bacterium]
MTTKDELSRLLGSKVAGFDATQPLSQQLNSLELFSIVGEVEKFFKVSFFSLELTTENLSTVDSWARLIDKKRVSTNLS